MAFLITRKVSRNTFPERINALIVIFTRNQIGHCSAFKKNFIKYQLFKNNSIKFVYLGTNNAASLPNNSATVFSNSNMYLFFDLNSFKAFFLKY